MNELENISKIINEFRNEEKEELIDFYIKTGLEEIKNIQLIKIKKITLFKHILTYISDKNVNDVIDSIMKLKIKQIRAQILDLVDIDYSIEKKYISKPEKWIKVIIDDIFETFELKNKTMNNNLQDNYKLADIYNQLLCDEIYQIFCSCEKFNSAGNQFLLNMVFYKEALKNYIKYDFDNYLKTIIKRFNKGKNKNIEEIYEILSKIN